MWQLAIPILASIFAARSGNNNNSGGSNGTTGPQDLDPMLKQLLDMQGGRMQQSQPLYEAIMRMAMGLLPTQYQQPIGGLPNGNRGGGGGGTVSGFPNPTPGGFPTDGSEPPPPNPNVPPGHPDSGSQPLYVGRPSLATHAMPSRSRRDISDVNYLNQLTG